MDFSDIDSLPTALQDVATTLSFSDGHVLFHRNEASDRVYVAKSGTVRLILCTRSGQLISYYTVNTGEICDEGAIFSDTHTCSAIAESAVQLLAFPKSVFLRTLQHQPDFAIAFMMQLASRLHTTKLMIELRSIRSARERVLHYLQLTVPPEKNTVVLKQPLKNIASELGISPEVLSRTLAKLTSEGVIARNKRNITLLELST
jgi:CRP/FNR family transcriptional regulator, dissimilatory nitrate respiration regulator